MNIYILYIVHIVVYNIHKCLYINNIIYNIYIYTYTYLSFGKTGRHVGLINPICINNPPNNAVYINIYYVHIIMWVNIVVHTFLLGAQEGIAGNQIYNFITILLYKYITI
ncbi:hypothetical protein B484DRAFT_198680 [Ochromonadaceae sp. CCMP2298]|nr:hypothetical protein B484DRAFT_198680 [Ochromonadaceae sp. CCMP2298]